MAMNRSILQGAKHFVRGELVTTGKLNRVEAVIRAYDPCLSCATQAWARCPKCSNYSTRPATLGTKATKIVQLEPPVRLEAQLLVSAKLLLLAPVSAILVKVIVLDPVLVTVIDLFPLLVPKACLPKSIDVGERVSVGDPVLPHPGTLKVEIRVFQMVDVPV